MTSPYWNRGSTWGKTFGVSGSVVSAADTVEGVIELVAVVSALLANLVKVGTLERYRTPCGSPEYNRHRPDTLEAMIPGMSVGSAGWFGGGGFG